MSKTIKDPALGNYEIQIDGSFTLVKNGMTVEKEGREQKPTQKTCGHFSTLPGALNEAARLLTEENIGNPSTIKDYASNLRLIIGEITQKFGELGIK